MKEKTNSNLYYIHQTTEEERVCDRKYVSCFKHEVISIMSLIRLPPITFFFPSAPSYSNIITEKYRTTTKKKMMILNFSIKINFPKYNYENLITKIVAVAFW